MHPVFISWSGGKDSCFACYRAAGAGLSVRYLLNMTDEDGRHSWIHRLSVELLEMQAQAIGIPLLARKSTMTTYETDFRNAILTLKKEGIRGGVFGDIDLDEHKEWVDRVCQQADVTSHLPLWGLSQEQIMRDFIGLGFEAIIVAAKADLFGEEWLGHKVDEEFLSYISELSRTTEITPCGEAGEYHTLVVNGPLFRQRLEILEANKTTRDGHRFLEILKSEVRSKK